MRSPFLSPPCYVLEGFPDFDSSYLAQGTVPSFLVVFCPFLIHVSLNYDLGYMRIPSSKMKLHEVEDLRLHPFFSWRQSALLYSPEFLFSRDTLEEDLRAARKSSFCSLPPSLNFLPE